MLKFFIILVEGYYWFFIDQDRENRMEVLTESDQTITDNIKFTSLMIV